MLHLPVFSPVNYRLGFDSKKPPDRLAVKITSDFANDELGKILSGLSRSVVCGGTTFPDAMAFQKSLKGPKKHEYRVSFLAGLVAFREPICKNIRIGITT